MKLDLAQLLRGEVKVLPFEFDIEPETVDDVTFPKPAHVKGQVTDQGGYKKLLFHVSLPYESLCARCLAPVSGVFELDFERTVALRNTLTDEQLEDEGLEYAIPEDGKIDVDQDIREEILMDFPMRFLCTEDCPGLCPKCGKPIRSGLCHCGNQAEIDPRMAVLAQLLDDDTTDDKQNEK